MNDWEPIEATATEGRAGAYSQELSRSLSVAESVFLAVSSASPGSSVFIMAPVLIAALGGASVLAMLTAAAVAACAAICYGELAATYPIAGGEYTWAARILGRPVGFALLLLTIVAGPAVGAILGAGAAESIVVVWPALSGTGTAVLALVFATVIATLSVRANSWIAGGFLGIELLVLLVLTVLGLAHPSRGIEVLASQQRVDPAGALTAGEWPTLLPLVPLAVLMLGGFQNVVYFAEETTGSGRQLSRAILASLAALVVIQVVPLAAVIIGAGSLTGLMTAASPISQFVRERGGSGLSAAMNLGIAVAIINAMVVVINVWARILFASARDRSWPDAVDRLLASVHVRFRTPVAATLAIGAAAVAMSFVPLRWLLTATAGQGDY